MAIRKRSRKIKRKEQRAAQAANQATPLTYTQAKWICSKHNVDPATVTFGDHAQITDPRLSEAITVVNMEEAHNEMIGDGIIEAEGDMLRLAVSPEEAEVKMRENDPDFDQTREIFAKLDQQADDRGLLQKAKDWVTRTETR